MSSKQRQELQSEGGGDAFRPPVHLIRIAEEDPSHPEHEAHMARVSLNDPENMALLESMRLIGWPTGSIVYIYKDGDGYNAADARRRLTFAHIVDAEWKKAKDKRYPMRCHAVMTDDPDTARDIANAHRKEDPPLVRARRYVEKRAEYGWPNIKDAAARAAACVGLRLDYANALAACLSLPADQRAKVNNGELPPDVAARAAKKGGAAAVETIVQTATDPASGKVDGRKAKAAAREMPKRPKARPSRLVSSFSAELSRLAQNKTRDGNGDLAVPPHAVAMAQWFAGDNAALDGFPVMKKALESAMVTMKEGAAKGAE